MEKIQGKIKNDATEFCSRYGRYRQPFAISALQVFDNKGQLLLNDSTTFSVLYARNGREDIFTILQAFTEPKESRKIGGKDLRGMCTISVEKVSDNPETLYDSSLRRVQKQSEPVEDERAYLQIQEFLQQPRLTPNFTYVNNLYIYPISANLGKLAAKTLCLKIEVKDADNFHSACLNVSSINRSKEQIKRINKIFFFSYIYI